MVYPYVSLHNFDAVSLQILFVFLFRFTDQLYLKSCASVNNYYWRGIPALLCMIFEHCVPFSPLFDSWVALKKDKMFKFTNIEKEIELVKQNKFKNQSLDSKHSSHRKPGLLEIYLLFWLPIGLKNLSKIQTFQGL